MVDAESGSSPDCPFVEQGEGDQTMGHRDGQNRLVIIGLLAALVMQFALPYLPVERMYGDAMPQVMAQAKILPIEATRAQSSATPEPTAIVTLVPYTETPNIVTTVVAEQTAKTTEAAVDLTHACWQVDRLVGAERALALSRLKWEPDYADAKVISSCNLVAGNKPKAVVLHHTGGELSGSVARFQEKDEASAHYIVDRDGTVYQLVPESYGAKHVNCYNQRNFCLATCPICEDEDGRLVEPYLQSVGIEIVNLGAVDATVFPGAVYEDYQMAFGHRYWEDYPPAQVESLKALVEDICTRWGIPLDAGHVIGHSLINQKSDPGPALNLFWRRYGDPARDAIWP